MELGEHAQRLNNTAIAMVAKIDALTAERDRWMARAGKLVAINIEQGVNLQSMGQERDALAAQVAYMLDGMAKAISDETGEQIDALKSGMASNLPAAAQRYLAADKLAQAYSAIEAGSGPTIAVFNESRAAYRKACEGGGV